MNLNNIGQIGVYCEDVDRATAFYRDILGMKFLFKAPPSLAFFDCGGVRLMLAKSQAEGRKFGTSVIYYTVADLPAAYENLLSQGVQFEAKPHLIAKMPDHELWMAFFKDSEQNLVGLMCEVRQ